MTGRPERTAYLPLLMELAVMIVLGAAAAIAVILPLVRSRSTEEVDFADVAATDEARAAAVRRIEEEVARYRTAIRAGTLCERCGNPNEDESRFCAECGRPLPGAASRRQAETTS